MYLNQKIHLKVILPAEMLQLKVKINNLFSNNQINNRKKGNLLKLKWLETLKFMRRIKKGKDKLEILGLKTIRNKIVNQIKTKIRKLVNVGILNLIGI